MVWDKKRYMLESSTSKRELDAYEFSSWYYAVFGLDGGSPSAVLDGLVSNNVYQYIGKGYSICCISAEYKVESSDSCRHPKKYLNKFSTFEFEYCPDCKKEI